MTLPLPTTSFRHATEIDMASPPRPNFAAAIYHSGEWAAREIVRRHQVERGLRGCQIGGKVELPDAERGASAFDIRELDRINARLARPYKSHRGKSADEQREADLDRRAELEAKAGSRRDDRELAAGLRETQDLAASRGEEVAEDRAGIRRILDRDPLLSLFRAGALTSEQLEAGQAVRDLYDLRMGDAASVAFDGMPAGTHDHERFVANRFTRAKSTVPVAQLETALLNGHYRTRDGNLRLVQCWPALKAAGMEVHVALGVLRWVCCEHNTLTSMARGRAYERNKQALCWALDVADEVLDGRAMAKCA